MKPWNTINNEGYPGHGRDVDVLLEDGRIERGANIHPYECFFVYGYDTTCEEIEPGKYRPPVIGWRESDED